ncbi:MFS transporter [Streptomyces sp. JNUCC 64]
MAAREARGAKDGTAADAGAGRALTALLTVAMALSMLQLFLLGVLGPRLIADLGVSVTVLGLTTTIGFGAAAALSPVGGRLVDRIGPRRALVALPLVTAAALALIASATGTGTLLAAVALGGLPQALANPATNKAILAAVPPARRAAVTGLKQSGVQLGALAAGLPLAALAAWTGWRGAVWTAAAVAVAVALWAARALPSDPPRPAAPAGPASLVPRGHLAWLAVFSLLLGAGIASVNTYVTLFGDQRLGLGPTAAAALVAVLGVAGVAGRIGWSKAARPARAPWLPGWLAVGSVAAALLLAAATGAAPLAWPAAVAVGVFAVSGNAVSMVLVIQRAAPGRAGQDSALVAAGFFAGFAVGPPLFAPFAEGGHWAAGWLLVAAEFAVAAAVALGWAARDHRRPAAGSVAGGPAGGATAGGTAAVGESATGRAAAGESATGGTTAGAAAGPGAGGPAAGGTGTGESVAGGTGTGGSAAGGIGTGESAAGGTATGKSAAGGTGTGESAAGGAGTGESAAGGTAIGENAAGGTGTGESVTGRTAAREGAAGGTG